ncbi:unnamed protein product [Cuscuta epithymum]|uniref:Pro-apoptotic serine protease NMA111 n=2 Tax=Cuscuta epithymum TaxID=186058 RepID=A0AAV0E7M4_9ASTE|nr:unnamed protein product [Cuscuta epithymum]CAH9119122.1 unnamed protein product [Cuscuta epithymum]
MLVVESVVPGGPADDYLEPGDILFHINGEVITRFLKLEMILDDNVGQQIELQIGRGGISMTIQLLVQDLHSITPGYFLEVSGAVIHPLSYQQARNFHFQCGLVYVAKPGYMLFRAGVPRHSIIKKFAGEDILRLEDLISVLSKLSSGARVPLEYINYTNRHQRKFVLVTLDRHEWYAPPQMYTRDDSSGLWMAKPVLSSGSLLLSGTDPDNQVHRSVSCAGEAPMNETAQHFDHKSIDSITDMLTSHKLVSEKDSLSADEFVISDGSSQVLTKERLIDTTIDDVVVRDCKGLVTKSVNAFVPERVVEPTLVMLEVHVPSSCMLDGVQSQHFFGTGVVVYHSETVGLVVVDMETVAVSVSDVFLSFAAFPIEIPGEVVFLHPTHNFAFVAYDPKALGNIGASAVHAAELLAEPPLCRGDTVSLVGLNKCLQTKSRKSIVTNACASLTIATSGCPHYIATNMEVIELDTAFGASFSGVLTDELGRVRALWGSFSKPKNKNLNDSSSSDDSEFTRGIPACAISKLLAKIISTAAGPPHLLHGFKQHMPLVRILEAKLHPTLLSKARNFGLSDSWIQALVKKDPVRRQVLRVECCFAGSRAQKVLEQGDMILAINKEAVTCFRDIEDACQALDQCANSDGMLHMTIFRQGCEIELLVGTDERDGSGTTRAISWCGCTVQEPHLAVRAHGFLPRQSGVYVARVSKGSPASRYGLSARQWIVNINGKKTPDLDAFIRITKELEHGKFVRLRTVNLNGKRGVVTLKQDLHYWPTWEISFDSCETLTWRRKIISALDGGAM